MGGLDGRFLISRLQPTNFKVRSLTTIATPHRGSSFADYMLESVIGRARLPQIHALFDYLSIPGGGRAFDNLTITCMKRFNHDTQDDPNVKYFSYGAQFEPGFLDVFRFPWGVIKHEEGDNDGLVSVASSQWGEYKETLEASHLDLVGWVGQIRYTWADVTGGKPPFKPASFCKLLN